MGIEGDFSFIKAEEVVNKASNRIENATNSLDTNKLVDKSITLPSLVPHPEQVDVHRNIERGFHHEYGEQGIVAYQSRYE